MTTLQQKKPSPVKSSHTVKIEYCDEPVSSFGGLVLAERLAERLRLWRTLEGVLPQWRGKGFSWLEFVKSVMMGLLSGSQGTYATQALRQDAALLKLLSLRGAPEEATVWRRLERLGEEQAQSGLAEAQWIASRRVVQSLQRSDLLFEGFVPVWNDGSLLEGSPRREGSKFIKDKGRGLMLSTLFVGPVLASLRLAGEGEGEHSCVRSMVGEVKKQLLKPCGLAGQALLLMDSLHGDDTGISQAEDEHLHYVIGANKLKTTATTLGALPEISWQDTGARSTLGWSASGVCTCWVQCESWAQKRLLVGRRFMREGEMIWNYAGVLTDLRERNLSGLMQRRGLSFAQAIWRLYDYKAGMETQFKDGLIDLGLHHPPCQQHQRNRAFYAMAGLARLLGVAVDLIGGRDEQRGCATRRDGKPRKRPTPRRMRLWRLRRELFALPARILRHARQTVVQLLGLSSSTRQIFDRYWRQICRC